MTTIVTDKIYPAEDGWHYTDPYDDQDGKDCRKFVALEEGGMAWVGVRAWNARGRYWMNNSEPETSRVLAWRDLYPFPTGRWISGRLYLTVLPSAEPKMKNRGRDGA